MSDNMGVTPEVRRDPDPFTRQSQAVAPPINYGGDGVTEPKIRTDESTPGSPLPLRPARAAANDRAARSHPEDKPSPTIPTPCG